MFKSLMAAVVGTKHDRDMKRLQPTVVQINSFESKLKNFTDAELQSQTAKFRERLSRGEALDSILPEAFATVREGSRRVLGMRHYDVQLIGGLVLHQGKIAEMKTGEGKTLVATLPVYTNALEGKGVHVVTVNDYLAKRDSEWMGRLYSFLGMKTGIIVHELNDRQRKESYGSDITYGTNNEFGFDYLRDNMKFELSSYVQRGFNYAIVDECDSILVDEARTPLIISGPSEDSTDKYYTVNKVIPSLLRGKHFEMEEKSKTASLTEEGATKVEELLSIDNLYEPAHIEILHHIYQGLKAHHLYRRDVEYMVKDGEVVIVDDFTGRLMPGRRWSDGLHQAIEAKEGVEVRSENQTLATITFQNYFRMYKKLSGMTGTADTEAVEFKKIYNLDVIVIPTNRAVSRKDMNDVVYKTEEGKFKALATDIKERHQAGQPVLVGTVSIEKSEKLSTYLKKQNVTHNVLNAKHHEREAEIIAQAGRKGAVTIATNMAGRGTDILLGGNPEGLAKKLHKDEESEDFKKEVAKWKETTEQEKREVIEAGGLYIMGTERHESRRIDNQLRGRAGRQGDPGASKFYLSLEDNLMRIFSGERIQKLMTMLNMPDDEPIEAPMVNRAIEGAQRKVEGHNFDIRKHLLEYDDVMNKQRNAIYTLRREVLEGEKLEEIVSEMMGDVASHIMDTFAPEGVKAHSWDLEGLNTALQRQFGASLKFEGDLAPTNLNSDKLTQAVSQLVKREYERQKTTLAHLVTEVQKRILLQTIDTLWKEHLLRMDHLKEGINLRAYAQKDPLIEYKKEAFNAFAEVDHLIKAQAVEMFLKIQIVTQPLTDSAVEEPEEALKSLAPKPARQKLTFTHESESTFNESKKSSEPARRAERVGRNDPCPCGSGKKYKKCHGADADQLND
ncbi:MAG: preprotein translocase subunit SecA [Bdellovibrionales bacterium]